jgi:hypothetical protein
MVARRLLIVLAVLLGLTALAAGVAPRRPIDSAPDAGAPAVTPVARAGGSVQRTMDAAATGQHMVARVGQTVELTVRSQVLNAVSLGDVGVRTAEADSPARFELLADVPGTYPVELVESGQRIGTLEIRAAG